MNTNYIILTTEYINKIKSKTKTQFRRPLKNQPFNYMREDLIVGYYHPQFTDEDGFFYPGPQEYGASTFFGDFTIKSPYGKPTDIIYVKEIFALEDKYDHLEHSDYADNPIALNNGTFYVFYKSDLQEPYPDNLGKWRHSIYMPHYLSRYELQIKNIRAQRLHNITREDAIAEGCNENITGMSFCGFTDERIDFISKWNGRYGPFGKFAWHENPYVWVVDFELYSSNQKVIKETT